MKIDRTSFVTAAAALATITVLAASHISHVLAPDWTPAQHAIVDSGGQLLALVGLFALALRLDQARRSSSGETPAPPPSIPPHP